MKILHINIRQSITFHLKRSMINGVNAEIMAFKQIKCVIVGDGYVLLIELRQNKTCLSSLRRTDGMSLDMRKPAFCICETKTQISFAVTTKLISAFDFATRILQSLYFLNPKFQASSHLLWLYRPICVRPDRKPRRPVFSQRGSYNNAKQFLVFRLNRPVWIFSEVGNLVGRDSLMEIYYET